jgi:pyrroloquinoline quinone biosynthesis protein B
MVFLFTRIIHDAWASTLRKLVSSGCCCKFVVSTGHPRREIDEFAKLASASAELLQWTNQTPVVVNNSGFKYFRFAFCLLIVLGLQWFSQKDGSAQEISIVVLGNAQDAGYPQAGCNLDCCKVAWDDASRKRMASCIALVDSVNRKRVLFDCTPNFPEQLRLLDEKCLAMSYFKKSIPNKTGIDSIFLTHAHIGHYTGLMHLGREVMGSTGTDVWAMPRMKDFLKNNGPWSQLVSLENVHLNSLVNYKTVNLSNNVSVTPLSVPHRDEFSETVGFRIEGPNKTALYLPDIDKWSKWDSSINDVIKSVDVAYVDGTFLDNGEIPGRDMSTIPHPFIAESIKQFSSLEPADRAKIRFIHLNHTNPALQSDSPARRTIKRAGMRIAEQGEVINL